MKMFPAKLLSLLLSLCICLFSSTGLAQPVPETALCIVSPQRCAPRDIARDRDFRLRPEIEFDVCDIWPDACSIDEISESPLRRFDLCALAQDSCTLMPTTDAMDIMIPQANMGGDLFCRISPASCAPLDRIGGDPGGPQIPFDICDIWPERCPQGSSTTMLSGCALVPEACRVVDMTRAEEDFGRAMRAAN